MCEICGTHSTVICQKTFKGTTEAQLLGTLNSINYYLESMGQYIDKYDMPQINQRFQQIELQECREIMEEVNVNVPVEDIADQYKMNQYQTKAFNTIPKRFNSETPSLFFVNGRRGTWKTFLYQALLVKFRSKGMIALAFATSSNAVAIFS